MENLKYLKDSKKDRQYNDIPLPPQSFLPSKELWDNKGVNEIPKWRNLIKFLIIEGRILKKDVLKLISKCHKIIQKESNILYLEEPINIVGDVHGQFYDLCKLIKIGHSPKENKYLFLGDYVDRGNFSIEVVCILMALKICYPKNVFLLRGNHECREMTKIFNFFNECLYKYDQEIYDRFMDFFDSLPLAAVVNKKFFAVHGGLSPECKNLEEINHIDRFQEIPKKGVFCDLLWSDPVNKDDGKQASEFVANNDRKCSFFYGSQAVTNFLSRNGLLAMIRAHEVQFEGYKMHNWEKKGFPQVITIFSAPNYCQMYKNKGAIIRLKQSNLDIDQFKFTPSPYFLPNFMNIFSWSIPFVSEKIIEVYSEIYKHLQTETEDEIDNKKFEKVMENLVQDEDLEVKFNFLNKYKHDLKKLREQSEAQLKDSAFNNLRPSDLNYDSKELADEFKNIKKLDSFHESRQQQQLIQNNNETITFKIFLFFYNNRNDIIIYFQFLIYSLILIINYVIKNIIKYNRKKRRGYST